MISPATVNKITEAAQVDEVVGEFVNLKKRGSNLIGLCPFHNEKTPSFVVSPSKGIYKCFGCGQAGNSVKFVMEHEQMTYPEALRFLAGKYNIEVEELHSTEEAKEEASLRESIYIANAYAQRYFTEQLFQSEEGKSVGLSYFRERGFTEKTIKQFELGYALEASEHLTRTALEAGYKLDILKKAGLTSSKPDSKVDFFRARVMFPIHNISGKVVGFGGRTLSSNKKIPKYINTPESDIYQKSRILYGAFQAKKALRDYDECLLVEGYTDVISLHQAGIENVVASSGTSLTVDQVKLIKRYTPNVTVLFDGDAAGIKAALRGVDIILEQDCNVRVVTLPDGQDPDSYVRELGGSGFRDFIANKKKDFVIFKIGLLMKEAESDPVKRTEVIREVVKTIAKIPDLLKRSEYVRECANLMDVREQILISEVNKTRALNKKQEARRTRGEEEQQIPVQEDELKERLGEEHKEQLQRQTFSLHVYERDIIRLLIEYGQYEVEEGVFVADHILEEIGETHFEDEKLSALLAYIIEHHKPSQPLSTDDMIRSENQTISGLVIELLSSPYEISENWEIMHQISIPDKLRIFKKDINSSMQWYKLMKIRALIRQNLEALKAAKEEAEQTKYLKIHQRLKEQEKEFASDIGVVVYGN